MSRSALNIFLLIALAAFSSLNWMGAPDLGRHNVEYFPDMAHSPRYNTFSANPNFPDGKTLQPPVTGTIPRGYRPFHFQATPKDALRAGEELTNSIPATDGRARERGAFVFTNFCQVCHGAGGMGNGPVAMRGFPAPPSLVADHAVKMKDGQMFHVLTFGQGNMPSYRAQISPEDRWKAILYLRFLQSQAPSSASALALQAPAPPGGGSQ